MGDLRKFNVTSLSEKRNFYSHLNMEDIIDVDYAHTQIVCKDFENKYFRRISWFYVESNTLLLAGVFESFRNIRLKICELDPAKILSAPGLPWQSQTALKKTKVNLNILTDIDMLSMVKKGIRERIYHSIYQY